MSPSWRSGSLHFVTASPRLFSFLRWSRATSHRQNRPRRDWQGLPEWRGAFELFRLGQASRVDIRLVAEPWRFDWSESQAELARLRTLRPDAAEWLHYSVVDEVLLDVFGEAPARKLAYRWLSDDLVRIAWLERGIY